VTGRAPVVRRMSISRDEFLRTLPAAVGTSSFTVEDDRVFVGSDVRLLEIEFKEETPLRIASLVLPSARITLRFEGYNADEMEQTVQRFDLYFRRGGG
jgi:hypothetical protein